MQFSWKIRTNPEVSLVLQQGDVPVRTVKGRRKHRSRRVADHLGLLPLPIPTAAAPMAFASVSEYFPLG